MSIYRSFLFVLGLLLCLGAATSCSSEPPPQKESAGTMEMPLQATTPSGNVYQLRSATFSVFQTGATAPTTTLITSAFADPATTLTAPLAVGSYTVSLGTGWQVVRQDAAGTFINVTATLVSANPASFSIVSNQTTNVGFTFNVPGDGSVGFGGNLGVSINVNEVPPDGGSSFQLTAGISNPNGIPMPGTVGGPGIACNGSATSDCTESFPAGTSIVLDAAPNPSSGLVFSGWSGAGCVDPAGQPLTSAVITVTMTQNITCIANFALPQQFTISVTRASSGGAALGSVFGPGINCDSSATSDCSETFPSGTAIVIDAAGAAGSVFTGWAGVTCVDTSGQPATNPVRTLTITQDVQCVANFGPASASFPPANLPVAAWYSAETAFITQSATGQVSSWADRSGNGRTLTQTTTAAQPTFDATGWSASGQGAVIFTGSRHMANTALGSLFNGTGVPFSVLAVIRMASDSDGAVATFEQATGSTGVAFQRARVSNGGPFLRFQATSDSGATFQNDENALLSFTTGNAVAWVNTGTAATLNTDGNPTDSAAHTLGPITTGVFRVGAALTGNVLLLDGRIAELFVVSRAVTATEYAQFRTYARGKWAGLP